MTTGYTFEKCLERINANKDWYNKSYAGYFFGIYVQGSAVALGALNELALPYGICFVGYARPHHLDWFWDNEEIRSHREVILTKAQADRNFSDTFYAEWKKAFDAFSQYLNEVRGTKLADLKDAELQTILAQVYKLYKAEAGLGYVVDTLLTDDKEDWLVGRIKGELGAVATEEVIAALTQPIVGSFVGDYEIEKYKIAAALEQGGDQATSKEACQKLTHQFSWIKTNYLDNQDLTVEEVLAEVEKLAAKGDAAEVLAEKVHATLHSAQAKAELYAKFSVSTQLQNILHLSELFTDIQDKRKEGVLRSNNFFFRVLEEIGRRFGQEAVTTYYLTIDEAVELLGGATIDWAEIVRRTTEPTLSFFYNDQSKVYFVKDLEGKINLKNLFHEQQALTEFSGSTAFKGVVRGPVRILRNSGHIATFRDGEILVANQTTPEFVPAMKKALAIITDQGGITCHAAIVARELKKPCIIGTKIATKVLKDGDLVEVDADKGLVRIIK